MAANTFVHSWQVLLIMDEIVDGGIILETDPMVLAKVNEPQGTSGKNGDVPLVSPLSTHPSTNRAQLLPVWPWLSFSFT